MERDPDLGAYLTAAAERGQPRVAYSAPRNPGSPTDRVRMFDAVREVVRGDESAAFVSVPTTMATSFNMPRGIPWDRLPVIGDARFVATRGAYHTYWLANGPSSAASGDDFCMTRELNERSASSSLIHGLPRWIGRMRSSPRREQHS